MFQPPMSNLEPIDLQTLYQLLKMVDETLEGKKNLCHHLGSISCDKPEFSTYLMLLASITDGLLETLTTLENYHQKLRSHYQDLHATITKLALERVRIAVADAQEFLQKHAQFLSRNPRNGSRSSPYAMASFPSLSSTNAGTVATPSAPPPSQTRSHFRPPPAPSSLPPFPSLSQQQPIPRPPLSFLSEQTPHPDTILNYLKSLYNENPVVAQRFMELYFPGGTIVVPSPPPSSSVSSSGGLQPHPLSLTPKEPSNKQSPVSPPENGKVVDINHSPSNSLSSVKIENDYQNNYSDNQRQKQRPKQTQNRRDEDETIGPATLLASLSSHSSCSSENSTPRRSPVAHQDVAFKQNTEQIAAIAEIAEEELSQLKTQTRVSCPTPCEDDRLTHRMHYQMSQNLLLLNTTQPLNDMPRATIDSEPSNENSEDNTDNDDDDDYIVVEKRNRKQTTRKTTKSRGRDDDDDDDYVETKVSTTSKYSKRRTSGTNNNNNDILQEYDTKSNEGAHNENVVFGKDDEEQQTVASVPSLDSGAADGVEEKRNAKASSRRTQKRPANTTTESSDDVIQLAKINNIPFSSSQVPVDSITVGSFKQEAKDEEIIAKFYFAGRKMVWEWEVDRCSYQVTIQFHDVEKIQFTRLPDDRVEMRLRIRSPPKLAQVKGGMLVRRHPKLWAECADFSPNNQLSTVLEHTLVFPPNSLLNKRDGRLSTFDKLLLSDPWLSHISERHNMPEVYNGPDVVSHMDWNTIKERMLLFLRTIERYGKYSPEEIGHCFNPHRMHTFRTRLGPNENINDAPLEPAVAISLDDMLAVLRRHNEKVISKQEIQYFVQMTRLGENHQSQFIHPDKLRALLAKRQFQYMLQRMTSTKNNVSTPTASMPAANSGRYMNRFEFALSSAVTKTSATATLKSEPATDDDKPSSQAGTEALYTELTRLSLQSSGRNTTTTPNASPTPVILPMTILSSPASNKEKEWVLSDNDEMSTEIEEYTNSLNKRAESESPRHKFSSAFTSTVSAPLPVPTFSTVSIQYIKTPASRRRLTRCSLIISKAGLIQQFGPSIASLWETCNIPAPTRTPWSWIRLRKQRPHATLSVSNAVGTQQVTNTGNKRKLSDVEQSDEPPTKNTRPESS